MKITKQWLLEQSACASGVAKFDEIYPDGVELSEDNIRKAALLGFDVAFVIRRMGLSMAALAYSSGSLYWYHKGKLHREDGPAVDHYNGTKKWLLHGELHREDGPAIVYVDGSKEWWLDGKRHREDGPAVERAEGAKYWWLGGKRHREDGPAIEYADGIKQWWLHGKRVEQPVIADLQKMSGSRLVWEFDALFDALEMRAELYRGERRSSDPAHAIWSDVIDMLEETRKSALEMLNEIEEEE